MYNGRRWLPNAEAGWRAQTDNTGVLVAGGVRLHGRDSHSAACGRAEATCLLASAKRKQFGYGVVCGKGKQGSSPWLLLIDCLFYHQKTRDLKRVYQLRFV